MWCRTILTAVAISYVICMLLWSGLQKEDLDPNTLEKLGRYNVNIDDMNNQQLRQECLVPHVTTEVQREALRTSTADEHNQNDVTIGIFPKIGMLLAANFEDRTVVQNEPINTAKENFVQFPVAGQEITDSGNATKHLGNKGIIKIEYNIQNQPNVESVMNFWTKLTRYTTTIITTVPTTTEAPITTTTQTHKAKNITETETYNTGYVHSREMEYINRILAEYLVNQTIPTTTEAVSTKKVPNYFPIKFWEMSSKASVEEERNRVNVQKEINKVDNVTEKELYRLNVVTYSQSQKNEPKVREPKPVKRNKTIGLLQKLLEMRNDLFNNGVIVPESVSNTETIKLTNKSKEHQEPSDYFDIIKLFQNMKVNKNNLKNDSSKSASIKAETWEPVPLTDENKESKASPVSNKETIHEQKFVMFDLFKTTPSKMTVPERTKIYHYDNQIEDVKKAKLHQNTVVEHKGSRFQAMLPSIKYSKQNKNMESTNSQVIGMPTDLNKVQESENVQMFTGKKAIINQQPVTIEKFARNQLFKMKNDTSNADSAEIEPKTKDFNGKQFKKALLFQNTNPTHDSKKIKAIREIINNFDRDNEELTMDNVNNSKPTQSVGSLNMSDAQTIPSSFIKEIAEKVKQIVLKDIGGELPTTAEGTTSTTLASTTVYSTSISTTVSTTEKPSTALQKEFTQTNHVMQDLMEIFKELKAMKDNAKLANQVPQNTTTVNNGTRNLPQLPVQPYQEIKASKNPYLMKNPTVFNPIQANSDSRILPVQPMSSGIEQNIVPQFIQPLNAQPTKDNHFGAITIQTNSDEIAPLAIQLSKPLKAMNQQIVVTTKRTVDKATVERERDSMKHINDNYRIPNENINLRGKLNSDIPKHVRFAEKHEFRDRYFRGRYREKPWYNHEYHEKVHNMENSHPVRTRFPELHYPGRLTHLEHSGRPRDLSYSEDLSRPRGHNPPGFNEPGYQQNGMRPHPGSYSSSDYDRRPRYEATKFHEKLERIENWPRNAWKDFHSPSDSSNDEISARQQLPLVKVKQRTRYDDTHFTNFLKSQQKVTDMLEKLLANNIKNSSPHSVEMP